ELSPGAVEPLRAGLPPGAQASLLDAPAGTTAPRWDVADGPELALMRSVKQNLDPAGVCNPGVYVGGI
ncbi:MAG: hypothetical protein J2O48_10660, partial [Solirubrobacterales bacterium]|nr:hypothetical protein [Solirubrobacterales bacterium]